jgi:hypothetical protein
MEETREGKTVFRSDNPIVQQILSGKAPQSIKVAAAKGALPVTREELLHILYFLKNDTDENVCLAVVATIDGMSDDELSVLLSSPSLNAEILDFFARMTIDKSKTAVTLVTHPAVSDDTVEFLSHRVSADSLELIVTNQVRLIRCPDVIKAALANPAIQADQTRRLKEVWEEFFVKKEAEQERVRKEREAAKGVPPVAPRPPEGLKVPPVAAPLKPVAVPVEKIEEKDTGTTYQRILRLSVPEKIQLALKGTKEERSLLLRDSNRVVYMSAVKSPKLSQGEVELVCAMRNVSEDVLRAIGTNREWMKNYTILVQLVKNPKSPVGLTMNFVNRLNQRDLKSLSVDKNVPEVLRRTAKQMLDTSLKRKQ